MVEEVEPLAQEDSSGRGTGLGKLPQRKLSPWSQQTLGEGVVLPLAFSLALALA